MITTLKKDFLSILDFSPEELEACLTLARSMKAARSLRQNGSALSERSESNGHRPLAGLHVALLFEKPSLRTRATLQIAVRELGGETIEPPPEVSLGGREDPRDVARNLERWVAAAVIRTFAQARLETFAAAAPSLHVINALTDEEHPCQALADIMTLEEHFGSLRNRTIAFVGDGNNVATSLAHAGVIRGARVRVASPSGFELPAKVRLECERIAQAGGGLEVTSDPHVAVAGADAVYTDVWTSMGQEAEAEARREAFAPFQVNGALMARARAGALVMHCLPAHRGEEITDEVIDSASSVVFDQAENRLHTQKALLAMLVR
jgi:ornithine carbamoyltransferase